MHFTRKDSSYIMDFKFRDCPYIVHLNIMDFTHIIVHDIR